MFYSAVVSEYDPAARRHHVEYLDGEDEWTDLGKETVRAIARSH